MNPDGSGHPRAAAGSAGLASEMARKAVHVAMGGLALLLRWLTPLQAALCAAVAVAFNLTLLHRLTGRALLRAGERGRGFSWGIALYPAAVLAVILVFRRRLELAAAVWGLLAFGDGMATVAGVLLRGPSLPWNRRKTWAGLVAFLLWGTAASAFLLRWTQQAVLDAAAGGATPTWIGSSFLAAPGASGPLPELAWLLAGCFAAAFAAAVAESLDSGVDDNVLVPLVGGATLFAATLVEPARIAAVSDRILGDLGWGLAVNVVLAAGARAAGAVSPSGAVWGAALGALLFAFAGWPGFVMLAAFFVLGTGATRVGYRRKRALGIAQERGGRRGARHAVANSLTGVACAFLAVSTPHATLFTLALVAAFATAACDTVSSEIGQALGRRHVLVTTFRRVAAGTDGAVSLEGTAAGLLAAGAVAALAWGVGLLGPLAAGAAAAGAFAGATLESVLGATVERRLRLDNEVVNFANTVAGALVAILLHALLRLV